MAHRISGKRSVPAPLIRHGFLTISSPDVVLRRLAVLDVDVGGEQVCGLLSAAYEAAGGSMVDE